MDDMVSNPDAYCLGKAGEQYVVYLKEGGTTELNLSGYDTSFTVEWFYPRNGGSLKDGRNIQGGESVSIGSPPDNQDFDWAVLVTVSGGTSTLLGKPLNPEPQVISTQDVYDLKGRSFDDYIIKTRAWSSKGIFTVP